MTHAADLAEALADRYELAESLGNQPGLRLGSDEWDRLLGIVLAARLP